MPCAVCCMLLSYSDLLGHILSRVPSIGSLTAHVTLWRLIVYVHVWRITCRVVLCNHTARICVWNAFHYAFRLFVAICHDHAIAAQIDHVTMRFVNVSGTMATYDRIFGACRFFVGIFQFAHSTRFNGCEQHSVYGRFVVACGHRNRIHRGYGCTQQFGQFGQINIILGHFGLLLCYYIGIRPVWRVPLLTVFVVSPVLLWYIWWYFRCIVFDPYPHGNCFVRVQLDGIIIQ